MKKLMLALIVTMSLMSCALFTEYNWVYPGTVNSEEELQVVMREFVYVKDVNNNSLGAAQLPHETYNRGSGDCEDLAGLAAWIGKQELGWKPVLVDIYYYELSVFHCIIKQGNEYYECTGHKFRPKGGYVVVGAMDIQTYVEIMEI